MVEFSYNHVGINHLGGLLKDLITLCVDLIVLLVFLVVVLDFEKLQLQICFGMEIL